MVPRKIVERAVRSLPLLLLPMIIMTALALALGNRESRYVATATVLTTERQNIEARGISGDGNPYTTPAGRHAQTLNELLRTRAFRADVAYAAGLLDREAIAAAPPERADSQVNEAVTIVSRAIAVTGGGTLLTLAATTTSPALSQALVTATVQRYEERQREEAVRQRDVAIEYYSQQIAIAQTELQKHQANLTTYLGSRGRPAAGAVDLEYNTLVGKLTAQEGVMAGLQLALQQVHFQGATADQSLESRFSVQDAARLPSEPIPMGPTERYGYAALALGLAIALAVSYLYVTYRTDHTLRSAEDFAGLPVPLLGYLPTVQLPWYRRLSPRRANLARRLAAATAGGDTTESRN